MKKTLILSVLLLALYACSTENDIANPNKTQKWELVKITGSTLQSEQTGSAMDFQEYYTIYNDSVFTKSRIKNTESWLITGTYNYMTHDDLTYIVFNYDLESPIIGNCSNNLKEVLLFESDSETTNTWHECDGPKLEYKKTETNLN